MIVDNGKLSGKRCDADFVKKNEKSIGKENPQKFDGAYEYIRERRAFLSPRAVFPRLLSK
jgi:hypothetical protein